MQGQRSNARLSERRSGAHKPLAFRIPPAEHDAEQGAQSGGSRVPFHRGRFSFFARADARRGQTLIEVLVALIILAVIFVFVSGDLAAVGSQNWATNDSLDVSAADYYLGIMKSDPQFWDTDWTQDQTDACGNDLGAYDDVYPTAPATPDPTQWKTFTYCGETDSFFSAETPLQGETFQYMWQAAQDPSDFNQADLTVWVRHDPDSAVYEYHAIRYRTPTLVSPTPYNAPTPTATPSSGPTSPTSPTPPPTPTAKPSATPTAKPTPKPTPTPPFGI
jgi:prepilin-type N-terminal cleavage/methylation domain-containing protein